jgi:hypothetical protein
LKRIPLSEVLVRPEFAFGPYILLVTQQRHVNGLLGEKTGLASFLIELIELIEPRNKLSMHKMTALSS